MTTGRFSNKPMLAEKPRDPLLQAIYNYLFSGAEYDRLPEDLSKQEEAEVRRLSRRMPMPAS